MSNLARKHNAPTTTACPSTLSREEVATAAPVVVRCMEWTRGCLGPLSVKHTRLHAGGAKSKRGVILGRVSKRGGVSRAVLLDKMSPAEAHEGRLTIAKLVEVTVQRASDRHTMRFNTLARPTDGDGAPCAVLIRVDTFQTKENNDGFRVAGGTPLLLKRGHLQAGRSRLDSTLWVMRPGDALLVHYQTLGENAPGPWKILHCDADLNVGVFLPPSWATFDQVPSEAA